MPCLEGYSTTAQGHADETRESSSTGEQVTCSPVKQPRAKGETEGLRK